MNTVWFKWLVMGLVIGWVLSACAPRHPRFPPPVDYERLELQMAALRESGVIGPREYDEEAWSDIELRLLAADNYRTRIEQRNRQIATDILERAERSVVTHRRQAQVDRSFFLSVLEQTERSNELRRRQRMQQRETSQQILDRIERNREFLRQQREAERRAAQAIKDAAGGQNTLLGRQRAETRRENLEKLTALKLITTESGE